jgi:hypothetical protein
VPFVSAQSNNLAVNPRQSYLLSTLPGHHQVETKGEIRREKEFIRLYLRPAFPRNIFFFAAF